MSIDKMKTKYCRHCKKQKSRMSTTRNMCSDCAQKFEMASEQVADNYRRVEKINLDRKNGVVYPRDNKSRDEMTDEENWDHFLENGFC